MDLIFEELDVLDRCTFALTSRTILCLAQRNEHLDYIIQSPPGEHRIQHFFEIQLGHGWIPTDLSYCPDCGRFVSTDQTHWRYVSEKYTREHSGNIARVWRERREDGWLRYVIYTDDTDTPLTRIQILDRTMVWWAGRNCPRPDPSRYNTTSMSEMCHPEPGHERMAAQKTRSSQREAYG